MKFQSGLIGICLSILFNFSLHLQASALRQNTAEKFEYSGTLSYLDGTPVDMSSSDIDKFNILHIKSGTSYTPVKKLTKGALSIDLVFEGDYVMEFMGQEITKFNVSAVEGKLKTNLSGNLSLPFNYIIVSTPDLEISLYNENTRLIKKLKADKNGYIALQEGESYFSNKFFTALTDDGFPNLQTYKKPSKSNIGRFNSRKLYINKVKSKSLIAGRDLIHQIPLNTFHRLKYLTLLNKQKIIILESYNTQSKKASLHKVNLPNGSIQNGAKIALDFTGKLVFLINKQSYYLNPEGALSKDDNIYVDPIYRFNNIFVRGQNWIAPKFLNIPLKEGSHIFEITCNGKWNDANPAHIEWGIKKDKLIDNIYHPEPGTKRTGKQAAALQAEYAELIKSEPKPSVFSHVGEITSQEHFEVLFDPNEPNLWKMDGDYNSYKLTNPERRYYPSGLDPESKIHKMDLKECFISIDRSDPISYSHIDPSIFKGIFYAYDDEDERKAAMESAQKNASANIGLGEDYEEWRQSGFNLFIPDLQITGPINKYEGPYPELRYKVSKKLGEYQNLTEAKKHCDKPVRYYSKYRCVETSIVSVCPDNYGFTVNKGKIITNYDALYCGEAEPEAAERKGDEIVIEFSAEGYISETRALEKRMLEAKDILISGHVTDKNGFEIKGAKIKLRNIEGSTESDETGTYHLTAKADGEESFSEVMDIKLQKITLEISHEELGEWKGKNWGIVSDGFTTLKLKVKAKGIRPNTVSVAQPDLGNFVEQSFLKLPLVLDSNGEGEMEYVPPTYLKNEELTKQIDLTDETADKFGLKKQMWVAEVPIIISYEDEEGKPSKVEFTILVTRPPVFLIHGFTGNEETWKDLGIYLRERKYESIIQEYYKGPADESTIERQSQKLGQYIQEIQKAYRENGILQTRVDIVAHSMGGLISRHYISNMSKYGEKAGIVIPYNVKLSREELAAARNQSPVKLIDIRKLIMVGTPNHGATWIDGRIGHLGAFMGNVHEVANSQLRSNSQFLANLNAGENQGRHLDPNVQYALLYGRRRLKSLYPPDNIKYKFTDPEALFRGFVTDDDGVVKVSSAKLNGVIDFAFPEKRDNSFGFIHSPSLSFPFSGDKSITTDIEIFDKVNELLLEDIPRTPLKNSFAKVYGSEGNVSMRYYSTEAWKSMSPGTNKKLDNYWCQFKTEEGRTRIAFFQNNYHWGSIHIEPNTILRIENASPELVEVYLQQGKARFTSRKEQGGGFEIAMGDETEKWYNFNPKAVVIDINTDFIIEKQESIRVHSVNGGVSVGFPKTKDENLSGKKIDSNDGIELTITNEMIDSPLPDSGWWSHIDTTYLPDEPSEIDTEMIIDENFSGDLSNWDTSKIKPYLYEKRLFWEIDEYNPLMHNTLIPLQNIIIEFDGWADKNGMGVGWYNSESKGYMIIIGAGFNTRSEIIIKDKDTYPDSFDISKIPDASLKLNTWQHFKFIVTNEIIEVYLDEKLIGSKKIDKSFEGEATLVFHSHKTRLAIDNLKVYKSTENDLTIKQATQQNLLVNASFEEGPNMGAYLTMRTGTTIPGWMISKETVDLTGTYFKASDGKRSIDLVGTPGLGAIEQTFETRPGESYQVKFDLAGNPAGGPPIKKMKVTAANQSAFFEFDVTGKTTEDMGWKESNWIFIAEEEKTTLSFEALKGETTSNYGAAIDKVSVTPFSEDFSLIATDTVEKTIPIQNLGDVEITAKDKYLPISGFTHLEVNAKNDLGSALESPYEVKIRLDKPELLPFIDITNPQGFIDNTGNYQYDITISEPQLDDFESLNEIPLEANFVVQIIHPQTKAIEFEKKMTLPLGMTLIQGQTIGPDYKPRQQPSPPEFYFTSYQIANQADEQGNFYILFNTTLYEKDIEKYKKLAERTQEIFSMDNFKFYLQWSSNCSLALKYMLPDSIKSQLTVANKVKIGRDGLIDLLSPEEHEDRIKQKVSQFIERMPLKPEKKSFVLGKLDRLTFRYSATTINPVFTDNLTFSNVIEAPYSRELFWISTYLNGKDNASFTLMMHVMGHFLHHAIVLPENRFYNFLSKKCSGNEKIWKHQTDLLKYMFDKSEYTSFSEAGADFFNYLIFQFIEQSDKDFVNKSIYYEPGYLTEFANATKAMQAKQKYPPYAVSGIQTSFLVDYYGRNCVNNPSRVFSDFLLNQTLYAVYSKGGDPASTINEWLVTKRQSHAYEYLDGDGNPFNKAAPFGLIKENQLVSLVPVGDFSNSSVDINGNLVSDFSQIPSTSIASNSSISIEKGSFNLIAISNDSIKIIELEPKCKIQIGERSEIKLLEGHFRFKSPLPFQTPLARFNPKSSNFNIKLEPDLTTVIVFEGEVKFASEGDEDTVKAGQSTTMNKKGKIRKPKAMKEIPVQSEEKIIEVPFRVYR